MAAIKTSMKTDLSADIQQVARRLKNSIGAELVAETTHVTSDTEVKMIVFEKFYFRNGSYATVTILLVKSGKEISAEIIGSGGGEGIFNISWGANEDFAHKAERILMDFNFKRT